MRWRSEATPPAVYTAVKYFVVRVPHALAEGSVLYQAAVYSKRLRHTSLPAQLHTTITLPPPHHCLLTTASPSHHDLIADAPPPHSHRKVWKKITDL